MDTIGLDALAEVVDGRVHQPAADRGLARLYGIRLAGAGRAEIVLDELGQGDARDLPRQTRLPAGLAAVALATTAWAAPIDDDVPAGWARVQPSRHPERKRMHVTVLVGGAGEDVSVLRGPGQEPVVVHGGCGVVHDLLVRCWNRRQDAPKKPRLGRTQI